MMVFLIAASAGLAVGTAVPIVYIRVIESRYRKRFGFSPGRRA